MKSHDTEVKLNLQLSTNLFDQHENVDIKVVHENESVAKLNTAKTLILKNCLTTTNV